MALTRVSCKTSSASAEFRVSRWANLRSAPAWALTRSMNVQWSGTAVLIPVDTPGARGSSPAKARRRRGNGYSLRLGNSCSLPSCLLARTRRAEPMLHELVVLGGAIAAGLLAVTSPCPLPSAEPVPEGAACGLLPATRSARDLAQASLRVPAVVEVTSHHCPACRKMEPVIAEAERGCDARVVRAFIEEPDGAALLVRHGIEGVPTFLVLDTSGTEVDRLVGTQSVASLRRALGRISSVACR